MLSFVPQASSPLQPSVSSSVSSFDSSTPHRLHPLITLLTHLPSPHTHTQTHTHSQTHTHIHTHTHTHTNTNTHAITQTHANTHTHTHTRTDTHTHTRTRTHTHTNMHTPLCLHPTLASITDSILLRGLEALNRFQTQILPRVLHPPEKGCYLSNVCCINSSQ